MTDAEEPENPTQPEAETASAAKKRTKTWDWELFDLHIKRWQAVAALVVAVGTIVAAIAGFHWPPRWPWSTDEVVAVLPTTIETLVRYDKDEFAREALIEIHGESGWRPMVELKIQYKNLSGVTAENVVVKVEYPEKLQPLPEAVQLANGHAPYSVLVGGTIVEDGMNIGAYSAGSNAYMRVPFMLDTEKIPCGQTTFSIRTHVRVNTMDMDKALWSNEALVKYDRLCK